MTYGYYDIGGMSNINNMIKAIGSPPDLVDIGGMSNIGPAPTPAPVFQYVDQSGIVHTFDSQAKLNAFIANLGKAEISAPPPAAATTPPKTFQAWNAVTGEYVDGYPTQAAADTASMEWAKTKQIIEEEKRQPSTQVSAITPIDQITEIGQGTGDTTMAPWTDWQNVFGELDPSAQYQAMMRTSMPNYALPGYQAMATRQFAPTFGRYLMQGFPATGTGAGQAYGAAGSVPTGQTGLGTEAMFSDWYKGQFPYTEPVTADAAAGVEAVAGGFAPGMGGTGTFEPSGTLGDIGAGWDLAKQYSALADDVRGTEWDKLRALTPGMSFAMQDPEAVRAMALAKYYGGGQSTGGYAGRAVASALQNMYTDWQARQVQAGATGPAGYLNYLSTLANSQWA